MGFKNTDAEFQHIEYTGCGSIGLGAWSFETVCKINYSFLFSNLISKHDIDIINIPEDIKGELIVLDSKEDKYFVNVKNEKDLQKYLDEKSKDQVLNNKIISIYKSNIINDNGIRDKVTKSTDLGKELLDLLGKANLKHVSLTSVGIAIAATYYEQIIGDQVNIDFWIN